MFSVLTADVRLAKEAAIQYRLRYGWNPLPSCRDKKRPMLAFSQYWGTPIEGQILANWESYGTPNIQLMCGARWGLAVVDLDGETARDAWAALCLFRSNPRTWIVQTGSGGCHLWYRLPRGLQSFPKRVVWRCQGVRHSAIEFLGDNSLVIAPPSRHVETRKRYVFTVGPVEMPQPAEMPDWMIGLSALTPVVDRKPVIGFICRRPIGPVSGSHDRADVAAAIPDKAALAASWGLRLTGRESAKGWLECHAIGREDCRPSAGFHPESGWYVEPGLEIRIGFFDLAVELGQAGSWQEACNVLGDQFLKRSVA